MRNHLLLLYKWFYSYFCRILSKSGEVQNKFQVVRIVVYGAFSLTADTRATQDGYEMGGLSQNELRKEGKMT